MLLIFCEHFFKTKSLQYMSINIVFTDVALYTRGLGRPRSTWQIIFSVQVSGVEAVQITVLVGGSIFR